MLVTATRSIYYLTGMGGRLHAGLGEALLARGWNVIGRELSGEFRALDFQSQVDCVAADLQTSLWHPEARVIANSFGAYLLLHALAQIPRYIGKVMLLSPIVGEFDDAESSRMFSPPYPRRLLEAATEGKLRAPDHCEIHVGDADWQSNPRGVLALGKLIGATVNVVPQAGHALPKAYVGNVVDQWLRAH